MNTLKKHIEEFTALMKQRGYGDIFITMPEDKGSLSKHLKRIMVTRPIEETGPGSGWFTLKISAKWKDDVKSSTILDFGIAYENGKGFAVLNLKVEQVIMDKGVFAKTTVGLTNFKEIPPYTQTIGLVKLPGLQQHFKFTENPRLQISKSRRNKM